MEKKLEKLKFRRLIKFQKPYFCLLLLSLLNFPFFAQNLPDKIRGYKVYKEKIIISGSSGDIRQSDTSGIKVEIDEPRLADISAAGIKLEIGGEITIFGQSGTIDFITFRDFEVNGINVEIEEYKKSFDFKKNSAFRLENPIEIFISTPQTLRAAWKEAKDSKAEWLVTGKVFVFGRFKKFGFNFKRVVPVEVKIKIPNPVKSK